MKRAALFLDRDGVINYNRTEYVRSWDEFEFLPGALPALKRLAELPLPIVVVSNQSMVGRGLVAREQLADIHTRMLAAVRRAGGRIDGIYCCTHRPGDGCSCRKPRPGLLLSAAADLSLDLEHSLLVGDAVSDAMAAWAVGCLPVLVQTGRGAEELPHIRPQENLPFIVLQDLEEVADWIRMPALLSSATHTRRPVAATTVSGMPVPTAAASHP